MLSALIERVRITATRVVGRIADVARAATRPAPVLVGLLRDTIRSREELVAENLLLSLEQAPAHRGPVWLDKMEQATLAPWGFGADVRHAMERRRATLRALGIAPEDPRRDVKLRELKRQAVGEGMAARTGQPFLAKAPDRFRGQMQVGPEGAAYAVVVSDGARFVLVPASREHNAWSGRSVQVTRDANGRLTVQELDRGRER